MIRKFLDFEPEVPESCYVDQSANVIGRVRLGENVSVWPGAVIRGDEESCEIGDNSNVQDLACIHVDSPCRIGKYVSIAHSATVHGATIGDYVLVGMGAVILDDAVIPDYCVVGAGALVTGGKVFEEGDLIIGSPARAVRKVTEDEREWIKSNAETYLKLLVEYSTGKEIDKSDIDKFLDIK